MKKYKTQMEYSLEYIRYRKPIICLTSTYMKYLKKYYYKMIKN